ncbi:response regulator [Bacillus subtilis subsp. subtilis]|nr:response regulator [Bacillus subtilis subsp. subtilis]
MNRSPPDLPPRGVILVVEDEIELSRLFTEVLVDAGFEVVPAYSVSDALGTLATQAFDVAVLDIELRDGPVFPVADRLAEIGTPFLFASAVYVQMVPKRHQGALFIGKPFNIHALVARVEDALHRGRGGAPTHRTAE